MKQVKLHMHRSCEELHMHLEFIEIVKRCKKVSQRACRLSTSLFLQNHTLWKRLSCKNLATFWNTLKPPEHQHNKTRRSLIFMMQFFSCVFVGFGLVLWRLGDAIWHGFGTT